MKGSGSASWWLTYFLSIYIKSLQTITSRFIVARERRVWTQAEIEEYLKKTLVDKDIAMFERLSRE